MKVESKSVKRGGGLEVQQESCNATNLCNGQWRNSPPPDFTPGNFWQLLVENEARKKGGKWKMYKKMRRNGKNGRGKEETEEKMGKNEKGKEENEKFKGKRDLKEADDLFFFCFSLL